MLTLRSCVTSKIMGPSYCTARTSTQQNYKHMLYAINYSLCLWPFRIVGHFCTTRCSSILRYSSSTTDVNQQGCTIEVPEGAAQKEWTVKTAHGYYGQQTLTEDVGSRYENIFMFVNIYKLLNQMIRLEVMTHFPMNLLIYKCTS